MSYRVNLKYPKVREEIPSCVRSFDCKKTRKNGRRFSLLKTFHITLKS